MKFKNLFSVVVISILTAPFFVSCEQYTPEEGRGKAVDNVILYGNCEDETNQENALGTNQLFTAAAATQLKGSDLSDKGDKIIGLRFFIADQVYNSSVFIGEDYENPEYTQKFSYIKGGWQYVLFDSPYEIKGCDLYIGYKITGSGFLMGMENTRIPVATEKMLFGDKWGTISSITGVPGRWSLQAIVAGGDYSSEIQNQIVLDNVKFPDEVLTGGETSLSFEVRNVGVRSLKATKIQCSIEGKSVDLKVNKALSNGQSVPVKMSVAVPADLDVAESEIILSASIVGKDSEPFVVKHKVKVNKGLKRNAILIEQFTGQACPNCPMGAAAIKKSIDDLVHPENVCWVAHHAYGRDMFTIDGDIKLSRALGVSAFPSCDIDRTVLTYFESEDPALVWHPAYTTSAILKTAMNTPASATIEIDRSFNKKTRELKVSVSGMVLKDEAYITVLINQDEMIAKQAGGGDQYQHTSPRAYLTDCLGDKLTLDGKGNYKVEYTYVVPEKVGSFECVLENMEVVAYVHGDIKNRIDREVYNADKIEILK